MLYSASHSEHTMLAGVALWKNPCNASEKTQSLWIFRWQRLLLKMTVENFGILSVTQPQFLIYREPLKTSVFRGNFENAML